MSRWLDYYTQAESPRNRNSAPFAFRGGLILR
jgi:hypothetical protein